MSTKPQLRISMLETRPWRRSPGRSRWALSAFMGEELEALVPLAEKAATQGIRSGLGRAGAHHAVRGHGDGDGMTARK